MYRKFVKRVFDSVLSALLILLLFPFFLIILALGNIFIGNPIFFLQRRSGIRGKEFSIIKLRSMRPKQNQYELDKDRLTIYGKIIRKTSLDEIPQLFNIIKGDMSFIGPRPLLPSYIEFYSKEEKSRLEVRPGMTGYAEIKGRHQISWEDQFKYDVYYVKNLSFALDLKIFIKTLIQVVRFDKVSPNVSDHKKIRLDVQRRNRNPHHNDI
jgi:lipopolysaccharide/colanic/teichoic acid biosynthesis glycosyltransferase